jgi:ABC-type phosphate/phosphonate transport system substrate-binding protein
MTHRIAVLPMYDFPPLMGAHDTLWKAVALRLIERNVKDVPLVLNRDIPFVDSWRDTGLLLGQACEYPLATVHMNATRLIASPLYTAMGCEGFFYSSAIVVRKHDPARTLADLKNRICAINQWDSNSGMNLLRAAVAPLAAGGSFFRAIVVSGSHRASVELVANHSADVAAIDCVTLAQLGRFEPDSTANLRILGWTPRSPSLPWVTARSTDSETLGALRAVLREVIRDPDLHAVREQLLLADFNFEPDETFTEVLRLQRFAIELGYPVLS